MESVTFRSDISKLMLSFPAERFGVGVNAEGEKAAYPSIHFNMGMYQTESEKLAGMLREHIGNKKQGGDDFWEEDKVTSAMSKMRQGDVVVAYNDLELTEDDKETIAYLERAAEKLAPAQVKNVCEKVELLQNRFKILGLPKPTPDMKIRRIKSRVIECLDALEEAGVTNDRPGDSG